MTSKHCNKCDTEKPLSEFHKIQTENRYASWCKSCIYNAQKKRWIDRKISAINFMGGKCNQCGYSKNYTALEFHHLEPSQKELDWKSLRLHPWNKIIQELKKCVLLCSNCHRETHHPEAFITTCEINTRLSPSLKSPTGNCPYCKTATYGTKFCSTICAAASRRKTERPSREELQRLIENKPYTQIAQMFDVTDNTIRKWAKCYGII